MSGLLELGPMTREISVMGKSLTIKPIPTRDVIALLAKFPDIVEFLSPTRDRAVTVARIGPLAVAHVIACATGELENPKAIEAALDLGLGKMMEILDVVFEITFEDGLTPFMTRIKKLLGAFPTEESAKASSAPWSASLVGDAPRKHPSLRRRANSDSGPSASNKTESVTL